MGIRLIQRLVELLEVGPADHAFTAHFKRLRVGNGQGYIAHDPNRMRHILADTALCAPGNGLLQPAPLVAQHKGKAVQLP